MLADVERKKTQQSCEYRMPVIQVVTKSSNVPQPSTSVPGRMSSGNVSDVPAHTIPPTDPAESQRLRGIARSLLCRRRGKGRPPAANAAASPGALIGPLAANDQALRPAQEQEQDPSQHPSVLHSSTNLGDLVLHSAGASGACPDSPLGSLQACMSLYATHATISLGKTGTSHL